MRTLFTGIIPLVIIYALGCQGVFHTYEPMPNLDVVDVDFMGPFPAVFSSASGTLDFEVSNISDTSVTVSEAVVWLKPKEGGVTSQLKYDREVRIKRGQKISVGFEYHDLKPGTYTVDCCVIYDKDRDEFSQPWDITIR